MKIKYLYAGIAAAAAIVAILVFFIQFNNVPHEQQTNPAIYLDFSYEEANSNLKSTLESQHINMSHPLRFSSQTDIAQYCNFLSDPKKQALVQYCTSSELRDSVGFLGDINMVGSPETPGLVIAALQSNPMLGNYDEVKTVFGDVINETICQCWDKEKPGGYATLSDMLDALRDFHINGKKPDSTTHSVPLENKHFEIELTTNQNGYLWKLLVAR
ncbi:MAG: hypothetical protein ABI340_01675 [Nitrososphaera sp.]